MVFNKSGGLSCSSDPLAPRLRLLPPPSQLPAADLHFHGNFGTPIQPMADPAAVLAWTRVDDENPGMPTNPATAWTQRASARLLDELDSIATRVTDTIRDNLPAYEAIDQDEHRASVAAQLSIAVTGIRDGRPPNPADLMKAEMLGRRRAEQGIAVSILMQAYQLPVQELWACYAAEVHDEAQRAALIALAPGLMTWMHTIGGAAADGHQIVAASRLADDVRMQAQLLELIMADPQSSQCSLLTAQLGMDAAGSFHAIGFVPAADEHELERLRIRLHLNAGGVLAAVHQSTFVVLQQEGRTDVIERLCRPHAVGGVLGIGQRRDGLTGARLSIGDAERAVALAGKLGRDVSFSEHWLLASVLASADHLDHLDAGIRVASDNPHLTGTVFAFTNHGFSVAATARAQYLHPNTVAYRLERWTHLTGWHLQDFEGVARSVVAIQLSSAPPNRIAGP